MFFSKLPRGLSVSGSVEKRLLAEYGAVFVAQNVTVPTKVVFRDEEDVSAFQSTVSISAETIGGLRMELQSAAMDLLRAAIAEAKQDGLSITPRDTDSARRSYDETVGLWASRVEPALDHWVRQGSLCEGEATSIRSLSPFEQVPVVLDLEEKGIYFAKDLSKSIIYSVAPPGTSQHLSLLAFDIKEHDDPHVRKVLARHHWFQTVVSDLPHFTYLGFDKKQAPARGLKTIVNGDRVFLIPDI